ncbi:MAG: GAF domain-containing protein [Anaerolineales bacterium]|nr:GAF domain-containing protein [Anaerolineales bacterium]
MSQPVYATYAAAIIIALLVVIILMRQFKKFSLRTKIAFGILVTGAAAVSALAIFGLNRAGLVINLLEKKYESNAVEHGKIQVSNVVRAEADKADKIFSKTLSGLLSLAEYRANLETRKDLFAAGAYWNARERIYQFPNGQYGSLDTGSASVFIPNTRAINETLLADLNTTAYLDFAAPNFLKENPEVAAVYYVSALGATTQYPNVKLAETIPAEFDATKQPYFTIADPQNDPERLPRWTAARQDSAGTGLIVTLSIPVYADNTFKGVISADLRLAQITEALSNVKVSESGFAFLLDSEGRILIMPPQGYALFGLQPEEIPANESPKQTALGEGAEQLQRTIQQVVSGETNLVGVEVDGVNRYVGFTPLETPAYRLVITAPENELNQIIVQSRADVQNELAAALQGVLALLLSMFIGAALISVWIGQVITSPLLRLTKTVERVAAGDTSARAAIETQDEIGALSAAFNTMTEKLNDSLQGLEDRVTERTQDLAQVNEDAARRAAQFEAIARVARTITSAQTLDALLQQIAETISAELNFYHVGIFLLDPRREFAILAAANSEGGKRMIAKNYRLQVGGASIIGYVTNLGQPRVALDIGADAEHFNNPDLPDAHSEITLPLLASTGVFGALDAQSVTANAFSQEDIDILSILADQVSAAIQNARSYQQSREAQEQAENASLQLSGQQWRTFLTNETAQGYYFDGIGVKSIQPADKRRPHKLSVPILLRGSQIGSVKLNALDPNHEWSDDEISIVQAAAERTALALDNARLLLESQKRAAKERTIGEISAKIGGLTNLESIIQTAIQELGDTLPDVDVAVQFTDMPDKP